MIRISMMLCFLVVTNTVTAATFPAHPPAPPQYENEREVVVIEVERAQLDKVRRVLASRYQDVMIRHLYSTALFGMSVEGKRKELRKINDIPGVLRVTPVSTYETELDESVKFIGGHDIRGYYDQNGRRLTGKGVKVGVIDTGIDYAHPDLRRNYRGGYDTIDNDRDPRESQGKNGTVHGSHVAGIIAANGKVRGVAPDAEIYAYRALGPGGRGSTETVLAAIEQAISDKVDVLNLSLGNDVNGPDWPTSIALNRAVEKGIVAVVASGNAGPGVWTIGSPGTASKAVSVGASSPPLRIPYAQVGGKDLRLETMEGSPPWTLQRAMPIVYAGLGRVRDMKGVAGRIVLVQRGEISFTEKARHAQEAGAAALLIFNNTSGSFQGAVEGITIPTATLSGEDGRWLRSQQHTSIRTVFKEEQDRIAPFSSRGPVTVTWDMKPDVVAPGVRITSTIPGGYVALQGTSMAAPHVAGAVALLKQAHPEWTPDQVKAALMNTAKPLRDEGNRLYHTYEQGAGRIQIEQAVQARTLIYPSSLPFGLVEKKDAQEKREMRITVENNGERIQKYVFRTPSAITGIQWTLPHTLYVKPHEKKEVVIGLTVQTTSLRHGLYEGDITVEGNGHIVRLPYLFLVEEPNYPRMMGFQFGKGEQDGTYKYEMYIPRGADELGIVLYDPTTFRYIGFLEYRQNVPGGTYRRTIMAPQSLRGAYKALIFVKKGQKEDTFETVLTFL